MRKLLFIILLASATCIVAAETQTNEVTDAFIEQEISKMKTYYLVLLKKGPNRSNDPKAVEQLQKEHLRHMFGLRVQGKIVLSGPLLDENDLRGICILNAKSLEEATGLMKNDPAVKSGSLLMEVHPWFGKPGDALPQ